MSVYASIARQVYEARATGYQEIVHIQQLHEALLFYEDPRSYVAENPDGARIWRDRGRRAARAMGLRVREDER